ncbi:MAG: hypothetical protein WCL60_01385 [Methylococcales bacterium]
MAIGLGNLSPIITSSPAGGSLQNHGLFLLGSIPTINASNLNRGSAFSAIWPQSLIGSTGLKKPGITYPVASLGIFNNTATLNANLLAGGFGYSRGILPRITSRGLTLPGTAYPISAFGFLNNTATLNAAVQEGGLGFTSAWPQASIGPTGLKQQGTAWASGPLGLFFDNLPLNGTNLPGSDPGYMPLYGSAYQAPLGVRTPGTASAIAQYSVLFNSDTLNQALLPGYDAGLMPLTGFWSQSSRGVAFAPSSAKITNTGIAYLYGFSLSLPTYHSSDSGYSVRFKSYLGADKASSADQLTFLSKDISSALARTAFKGLDNGAIKAYKTFYSVDKAGSADYKTLLGVDSGVVTLSVIRYHTQDNAFSYLKVSFKQTDFGWVAHKTVFAQTDKAVALSRWTFKALDTALATLNAFSPIWPAPFISPAGLHTPATASAISLYGCLNTAATLNTSNLQGGFGFTARWPQARINNAGLRNGGTASATGSTGLLFNGDHINLAGYRFSQDSGFLKAKNTFKNQDSGSSSDYRAFAAKDIGKNTQIARYHIADVGQTQAVFTRYANDKGANRLPQAGLAGYLLYRGVDTAPDFTLTPWQTFASLPFTTPALESGHTYQFVLKKRNEFGFISAPGQTYTVTPGSSAIKPAAPTALTITPAAGGTVIITASYDWRPDGANAADTWLIYIKTDGTTPNPATDTPVTVSMWKGAASALLNWQSASATEGATVNVLIRTRRSGSGSADSNNTTTLSATATFIGPPGFKGVMLEGQGIGESLGF